MVVLTLYKQMAVILGLPLCLVFGRFIWWFGDVMGKHQTCDQ